MAALWTHVAGALVALAVGAAGGWHVRAWKAGADRVDELVQIQHDERRKAEHVDHAAAHHESVRAQLRAEARTITREVERVVEKPVYRDVCLDADGVRILSATIDGAADPGQSAPAVPAAAEAR